MKALISTSIVSFVIVALAACADDPDSLTNGRDVKGGRGGPSVPGDMDGDGIPDDQDPTPGADPTQPGTCKVGVPHVGFAGTDFVADRKPGAIGVDHRRVKPFTSLVGDFRRVLGNVPAAMNNAGSTYGDTPARWYSEPTAGAVSLNSTYNFAFTGCYDMMSGAQYGAAPTPESAKTECATMQRKFWQRTATPEENQACVDFVIGLGTEPVARRRWAHACASIMTAAGFTTY